jgi:hypothetical protein
VERRHGRQGTPAAFHARIDSARRRKHQWESADGSYLCGEWTA